MFRGDEHHEQVFQRRFGSVKAGVEAGFGEGKGVRGGTVFFIELTDEARCGVSWREGTTARGVGRAKWGGGGKAGEEAGKEGDVGEKGAEEAVGEVERGEEDGE